MTASSRAKSRRGLACQARSTTGLDVETVLDTDDVPLGINPKHHTQTVSVYLLSAGRIAAPVDGEWTVRQDGRVNTV